MIRPARVLWAVLAVLMAREGPGAELRGQEPSGATVSIRGWVVEHETGTPLEGAMVALASVIDSVPDFHAQLSQPSGEFLFAEVPVGRYELLVNLLGYTELRDTLDLSADADLALTLPLSVSPLVLEPVVVVIRRRPVGPLEAFERRRATARGTFLTRQDIDRSNPEDFTDLLRTLPGIRLVPTGTFGNRVYFRGGCTPDLWLDGAQVGTTVDIDTFLRPEDLEAVEVYRGPDLPGEFGNNLCGAIVAWTRRGDPSTDERSLKTQLIWAGAVVLFFLIRR